MRRTEAEVAVAVARHAATIAGAPEVPVAGPAARVAADQAVEDADPAAPDVDQADQADQADRVVARDRALVVAAPRVDRPPNKSNQ